MFENNDLKHICIQKENIKYWILLHFWSHEIKFVIENGMFFIFFYEINMNTSIKYLRTSKSIWYNYIIYNHITIYL